MAQMAIPEPIYEPMRAADFAIIDISKFLMTLGIVLLHCGTGFFLQPDAFPEESVTVVNYISDGLSRACVPSFFLISGFLFFRNLQKMDPQWWKTYGNKLKRRVSSLLVPYLIWNAIALAITIGKIRIFGFPDYGLFVDGHLSPLGCLRSLLFWDGYYPVDGPLWFIRDLMAYLVLAPLAWALVANPIVALLVLILGLQLPSLWINPLFFLVGCYLGVHGIDIFRWLRKIGGWLAFIVFLALTWLAQRVGAIHMLAFFSGFIFFMKAGMEISASHLCHGSIVKPLIKSSFFIFAFHGLFTTQCSKTIHKAIGLDTCAGISLEFLLTFVFVMAISLGAYFLLIKSMPKLAGMLTGNRS